MRLQLEQDISETRTADVDLLPDINTDIRPQLAIDIAETASTAIELEKE